MFYICFMTIEHSLEKLHLRPRFKYKVHDSADKSLATLRAHFDASEYKFRGEFVGEHIIITVNKNDEHYWSPSVSLRILQHKEGSIIKGLFGPRPEVWTLFAFLRFTMLTASIFLTIIGLAQLTLDNTPWALYGLLPILALAVIVWIAGRIGKQAGQSQMDLLKNYVFTALKDLDENVEEEEGW
jgi:hypothetical protein